MEISGEKIVILFDSPCAFFVIIDNPLLFLFAQSRKVLLSCQFKMTNIHVLYIIRERIISILTIGSFTNVGYWWRRPSKLWRRSVSLKPGALLQQNIPTLLLIPTSCQGCETSEGSEGGEGEGRGWKDGQQSGRAGPDGLCSGHQVPGLGRSAGPGPSWRA